MKTEIELEEKECPSCHLIYWISKAHGNRLRKTKETFYCPNGHSASFPGKTDEQKYKEEKETSKRYYRYYEAKAEEIIKLEKKLRTYKGQITKLKKKVKK